MLRRILGFILAINAFGLAVIVSAQQAKTKPEPLVEQVKRAIDRGVRYLKQRQLADGSWDVHPTSIQYKTGGSSLAVLALLEAGVPVTDKHVKRGLDYVRSQNLKLTYIVALQTMVLAKAGQAVDLLKIQENAKWLIEARLLRGGQMEGWTYGAGNADRGDGSNTQYALLGLWAAKDAGVEIPEEVWKSVRQYYLNQQHADGAWSYRQGSNIHGGKSMTMTTAGLSGLLLSGMEIKQGREKLQPGGAAIDCGAYQDNVPLAKAMNWLVNNFQIEAKGRTFYNLYGIERAGRLSGLRFFGDIDWYREGCRYLVARQHTDGSWWQGGVYDRFPIVSTSFALLFLSKGRTPILISRLVHGRVPRDPADTDWNRDRHALKHLTGYVSKHLFKRMPLGWQNFDVLRAVRSHNNAIAEEDLDAVVSDLLQSPIVFLNGHFDPSRRLTDIEVTILRKYIENGGFLVAEACCGSKDFDDGIQRLVDRIFPPDEFPGNRLEPLPPEHSIWKAFYPVPPGSFRLKGLQLGCKTVMVYSPEDLSCRWEADLTDDADFRGRLAFRLGANIVAYATGLEPPQPRLTPVEVVRPKIEAPRRGSIKPAQLKHGGDWRPAPHAMRNLMAYMQRYAGLLADVTPAVLEPDDARVTDFKFLYMHGRGDPKLDRIPDASLEPLRFNLKTGGLLLADACCGNKAFDRGFRRFVKRLFPKHKLERVPLDDVLFSAKLNGKALNEESIRLRTERGGKMLPSAPFLEGIKIDDRWVLLYSKYDIGCALERHRSSDCLGYDFESAKRIGGAAVLYLLSP